MGRRAALAARSAAVVAGARAAGRGRRRARRLPDGRPARPRGAARRLVRQPRARSARLFLTDHLLAFEITSIVLLVAAVGGVVLGSQAQAVSDDRTRR